MVLKLFTEIEVKLSIMPTVRAKRGNGERSESNRPPFGYRTWLEMKLLPPRLKRDHLLKRNLLQGQNWSCYKFSITFSSLKSEWQWISSRRTKIQAGFFKTFFCRRLSFSPNESTSFSTPPKTATEARRCEKVCFWNWLATTVFRFQNPDLFPSFYSYS